MKDLLIVIEGIIIVGFCIPIIKKRESEVKGLLAFLVAIFFGMMAIQYAGELIRW